MADEFETQRASAGRRSGGVHRARRPLDPRAAAYLEEQTRIRSKS